MIVGECYAVATNDYSYSTKHGRSLCCATMIAAAICQVREVEVFPLQFPLSQRRTVTAYEIPLWSIERSITTTMRR